MWERAGERKKGEDRLGERRQVKEDIEGKGRGEKRELEKERVKKILKDSSMREKKGKEIKRKKIQERNWK